MRQAGYSWKEIGEFFCVSRQAVWGWVNPQNSKKHKTYKKIFSPLLKNAYCQWGERCIDIEGFPENRRHKLVIHHKDGDHNNDNPENIQILCRRCHSLFHSLKHSFKK